MKGKYQKKKENTWETQKTKKIQKKTKRIPKLTSRPENNGGALTRIAGCL